MVAWSCQGMNLKKSLVVVAISFAMSFVLFLLHQLVTERSQRRDATSSEIARSSAGDQWVRGPVLVVATLKKDGSTARHYVFPESLEGEAKADTLVRRRGIYRVPSFVAKQHFTGRFTIPGKLGTDPEAKIVGAQLFVAVAEPRGLRGVPTVKLGTQSQPLELGTAGGVSGLVSNSQFAAFGSSVPFEVDLELEGTRSVGWSLFAKSATLHLTSDWKDPSFSGATLPAERHVSPAGFDARWQTNAFTSNFPLTGPEEALSGIFAAPTSGIDFVETVDVYTQTDRATKYGFLFIGLTFASFFLFEVVRRLPIHPVQYAMVGLGIAIFFLLLLSLSEHVPFTASYGIASVVCVGATTFYLRHVLGGLARGLGFGAMQAGLYGMLFVLLRAEEYALLLGSGLLFGLLCAVMFVTRKVDWFALTRPPVAAASGVPGCPMHPLERTADCVETAPYR